ncbi:MAG: spore cortex biosynthesis protein YabQ [Lachnospiraceae bacterium]|nr:spore cortex biosynthesis protein YabQ [Lachnospiraceae bacterium]
MLSQSIYQEIQFLFYSLCLGVIITFVYDNIRVLRRVLRHNNFFVSLEDLLFWVVAAIAIFLLQHKENNGVFRWFSIIGAFVGMLLYRKILSNFYIRNMTVILKHLLRWLYLLFSYLFSPIYYLEGKGMQFFKYVSRMGKHALMMQKIRLTSYGKMIKMTLCKRKKKKGRRHEQKDSRS